MAKILKFDISRLQRPCVSSATAAAVPAPPDPLTEQAAELIEAAAFLLTDSHAAHRRVAWVLEDLRVSLLQDAAKSELETLTDLR